MLQERASIILPSKEFNRFLRFITDAPPPLGTGIVALIFSNEKTFLNFIKIIFDQFNHVFCSSILFAHTKPGMIQSHLTNVTVPLSIQLPISSHYPPSR